MTDFQQLLMEISHCSVAAEIRSEQCECGPYHKIVKLQSSTSFQLSEPGSGRLNTAPMLFINSNPSIAELEMYPDDSWESERIIDDVQHVWSFLEDGG